MKLINFEVLNFRSITDKISMDFNQYAVIVGANNIGKSNLLNALILSLDLIKTSSYMKVIRGSNRGFLNTNRNQYIRERDFPFNLKNSEKKHTIFKLKFRLSEDERTLLKTEYGLNLNTDITLQFDFTINGRTYDIIMHGKAKQKFNENKHNIANFIAQNLHYNYIPCIRDAQMSEEIFQKTFQDALTSLAIDEEYSKCLETIKNKENVILEKLENSITETISTYIPTVSKVHFDVEDRKRRIFTNGTLYIDDGVDTALEFKGDGIKSLTAIALLSNTIQNELNSNTILCIEEPEAHLHSSAIYGIKKILKDAAQDFQIIMSTHSPILVDKEVISNNIIISNKGIKKCRRIEEVKDVLGIQLSEELIGNEIIVLVEGMSDERIIRKLLSEYIDIEMYILKKRIKIINMRGGTKASNLVIYYNSLLISTHIVLDNDISGKNEYAKLISKGFISPKDITITTCRDMECCEIEDMISVDVYNDYILENYGVDIKRSNIFNKKNKEWSVRMKETFVDQGQPYDDNIEQHLKEKIADFVVEKGYNSLYPHRRSWVRALAESLEKKIHIAN